MPVSSNIKPYAETPRSSSAGTDRRPNLLGSCVDIYAVGPWCDRGRLLACATNGFAVLARDSCSGGCRIGRNFLGAPCSQSFRAIEMKFEVVAGIRFNWSAKNGSPSAPACLERWAARLRTVTLSLVA